MLFCHVGSKDGTQAVRLSSQVPLSTEPSFWFLICVKWKAMSIMVFGLRVSSCQISRQILQVMPYVGVLRQHTLACVGLTGLNGGAPFRVSNCSGLSWGALYWGLSIHY